MFRKWMRLNFDAAMLGIEAQRVVGLRLMTLAAGGTAAQTEALRMVSEKPGALAEAAMTLARGGSAETVIRRYRSRVRANKDASHDEPRVLLGNGSSMLLGRYWSAPLL
jgi:hypothetical protein